MPRRSDRHTHPASVVDKAAWLGDSITSGLISLAHPALTAVYPGTDQHQDQYCSPGRSPDQCNQTLYSCLTDNMFFQQKVAKPVFALALSRDESRRGDGGYLTIGGIPQLDQVGVNSNSFASTKIKVLPMDDRLRYYLIGVEGLVMLPIGTPIPADGTTSTTTRMSTMTTTSRTSTTNRTSSTKAPGGRSGNNGGNWWETGGEVNNQGQIRRIAGEMYRTALPITFSTAALRYRIFRTLKPRDSTQCSARQQHMILTLATTRWDVTRRSRLWELRSAALYFGIIRKTWSSGLTRLERNV